MSKLKELEAARDAARSAVENWTRSSGDNWDDLWSKYRALHDACKVAQADYESRLSTTRDAVVEASRAWKQGYASEGFEDRDVLLIQTVDALEVIETEGSGGEVG